MRTITAIKADIGSIGGHTKPTDEMLHKCNEMLEIELGHLILDYRVTFTGDDICLLMVHDLGEGNHKIHNLSWRIFNEAADIAKKQGLYGAGQDLLTDAPSGNVRGAGPGVAEIAFNHTAKERPAEAFMVITMDKCGPGAFNFPLWAVFTSPLFCSGLFLPKMKAGFVFKIIDMEHAGADRFTILEVPERHLDVALLLRDENFGVQAIYSRSYPNQKVVSVSTDRLHTIAGEYKGKDDPVAIIRTQGIFPAPEEVVMPFVTAHYVAGDARGSHNMALMPVAINTAVTGPYCIPIVAAVAYSINQDGKLYGSDIFGNPAWDSVRMKAQEKGLEMRKQGFIGPAMLPIQELEYGAIRQSLEELKQQFTIN